MPPRFNKSIVFLAAAVIILLVVSFSFREHILSLYSYVFTNVGYFFNVKESTSQELENMLLKKEVITLRERLAVFNSLEEENSRLRRMLAIEQRNPYQLVAAFVLMRDPTDWRRMLLVNKGKIDGIQKGMLVVNDGGNLVGRIEDVYERFSYVILLSDPSFKIIARIKEKDIEGIFKGSLSGKGSLMYVSDDSGIQKDDVLYVSQNSAYPWGFVIGRVCAVSGKKDFFHLQIDVDIFAHLSKIKNVFIVRKPVEYLYLD